MSEGTPTKRRGDEGSNDTNEGSNALVLKKPRKDEIVVASDSSSKALSAVNRTSNLQAPIMLLTGHQAEVFSVKFSPLSGKHLASASADKTIMLWNVYGDCESYYVLRGHNGSILEVQWSTDEGYVFSASVDKTVGVWDTETGARLKRCKGHTNFVNSCCPSRRGIQYIVSGSDDCSAKIWDIRARNATATFRTQYPTTAVCFSDQADLVYTAGIDNCIKVWDVRKQQILRVMEGHTDTITGLRLSPDGYNLISNSMDDTVRMWDVRPWCPGSRELGTFQGITHNSEKTLLKVNWSPDGSKISGGSADRLVYIWDSQSKKILYRLPGHIGAVNEVDFHPLEPIIASASTDKNIYLGEIRY